jgi:hypothetical protein
MDNVFDRELGHEEDPWLIVAASCLAGSGWAADPDAASAAAGFYTWYLAQMDAHQDPLNGKSKELAGYVDAARLAAIHKQMNSPDGLDSDYFLKSQDYLETWPKNIAATKADPCDASKCKVHVALGVGDELERLDVVMISKGGSWKLSSVTLVTPSK